MPIEEDNLRVSVPPCEKSIPSRTFLILTVAFVTALMVSNLITRSHGDTEMNLGVGDL